MTTSSSQTSSAQLTERFIAIERAAVQAGERIPSQVAQKLEEHLETVRERIDAGVDFTVVALVGGTGSGKSSLFNALTGINFAEVGVKRPTTSEPLACVWGSGGEKLLNHLEISTSNRFQRESELDIGTEDELQGLVLVDVPDHDSIAEEHRGYVDHIVPLADVLIWVLDPQKYADAAVHTGYLQELTGHERSLLVALNKTDTVPEDDLPALKTDLARLLGEDGLEEIPITAVSTVTETGVGQLRQLLADLTQTRSAAAERAAVELRAAGELLAPTVAESEPQKTDLPRESAAATLAEAGDFLALEVRMRDALGSAKATEKLPEVAPDHGVESELVETARGKIITAAQTELPDLWAQSVAAAAPSGTELEAELRTGMQGVPLPAIPSGLRRAKLLVLALIWVVLLAAIGWAGWLLAVPDSAPQPPKLGLPYVAEVLNNLGHPLLEIPLLAALLSVLALVFISAIFRARLRRAYEERAREYGVGLRRVATELIDTRLVAPIAAVHNSHREVREVITKVRSELAGVRPADVVGEQVINSDEAAGEIPSDA